MTMTPYDSLMYMKTILRTGLMSMDPVTGYVKAYVGGPDFTHFQYDMVSRETTDRLHGKAFPLHARHGAGFHPCSMFSNTQPVFSATGRPQLQLCTRRRDGRFGWALTNSNNWISARLVNELTPGALANKMRMFGITGYRRPSPLPVSAQ